MALRYLTAGESHGPVLTTIIEGIPAGMPLNAEGDINTHLARRQLGYGRGGRMAIEQDRAEILSGVRGGITLGSPLSLQIKNRDWKNWQEIMNPLVPCEVDKHQVNKPRPGHADLTGAIKYGHSDLRNVLERSSARETAARVAAGSVARKLLSELGAAIASHVISIGSSPVSSRLQHGDLDISEIIKIADSSPVRCLDPEAEAAMLNEIKNAQADGDSLGGVFEIIATGMPPGIGSYVHWDRRLDGRLAAALMSIQAIKGVEIGLGFEAACLHGSKVHDEIYYQQAKGFYRKTNRAGGIEGGMTNGEAIILRVAMKPIPTLTKPLYTIDLRTGQQAEAAVERADTCAVPAAAVVGEAVVAWELTNALLETIGGDRFDVIKGRTESMKEQYKRYYDLNTTALR